MMATNTPHLRMRGVRAFGSGLVYCQLRSRIKPMKHESNQYDSGIIAREKGN
jgi:hypothetical protein